MYAWLGLILALLAIVAGLGVGGLNVQPVTLHLLVADLDATLGVLVVGALALGILLGAAAVYLGRVLPLRFRLRRARRTAGAGRDEAGGGGRGMSANRDSGEHE